MLKKSKKIASKRPIVIQINDNFDDDNNPIDKVDSDTVEILNKKGFFSFS